MLQRERQAQMIQLLLERGFVKSGELARHFDVSDMTIRRDLERCEEQGWIQRCYGGAILTVMKKRELEFQQRRGANQQSKQKMAGLCADLVEQGATVYLGSGTTLYEVAQSLREIPKLTVYTCDLQIAHSMLSSNAELHILGGIVQKYTGRIGGQTAMQTLLEQRFDIAFCGTGAISSDLEVLARTAEHASFQRLVRKNADACYIVADSSKFRRDARHKVLCLSKYTGVVTDHTLSPEEEQAARQKGVNIIPTEQEYPVSPPQLVRSGHRAAIG